MRGTQHAKTFVTDPKNQASCSMIQATENFLITCFINLDSFKNWFVLEYDYVSSAAAKQGAVTQNMGAVLTFGCGYRIGAAMVRLRVRLGCG